MDTLRQIIARYQRQAARRAKAAERRRKAARLAAQGLTQAEIGRRLGVSRQAVHQMLRRGA